jgi:hypothetical protein
MFVQDQIYSFSWAFELVGWCELDEFGLTVLSFIVLLEASKRKNASFRTHSRTRSERVLEGVPNAFRKVFRTRSRRFSERVSERVPNAFAALGYFWAVLYVWRIDNFVIESDIFWDFSFVKIFLTKYRVTMTTTLNTSCSKKTKVLSARRGFLHACIF